MAKKAKADPSSPTEAAVATFQLLSPLLDSLYDEVKDLSKKDANTVLNPLKIKMINRILNEVRTVLGSDPVVAFLDVLAEDALPLTSDAVLILSHFKAAMEQFKEKHHGMDIDHQRRWFTQENP